MSSSSSLEAELEQIEELLQLEDTPENRQMKVDLLELISLEKEGARRSAAATAAAAPAPLAAFSAFPPAPDPVAQAFFSKSSAAPKYAASYSSSLPSSSSSSSSSSSAAAASSSSASSSVAAVPLPPSTHSQPVFPRAPLQVTHKVTTSSSSSSSVGSALRTIAVSNPFVIPDNLRLKETDTSEEKEKKRRRVKSLKSAYNAGLGSAVSKEKQSNWQDFLGKNKKKRGVDNVHAGTSQFRTKEEGDDGDDDDDDEQQQAFEPKKKSK